MPYQLEDIAGMVISFLPIDDGYALAEAWYMGPELMKRRTDPLPLVSKAFRYPRSLLAAMADEGCVLAGSQSLEFFVPGSVDENSDWDVYVPGNMRAITNMLAVLQECGVEWHWPSQTYDDFISGPAGAVIELSPWYILNILEWSKTLFLSTVQVSQRVYLMEIIRAEREILLRNRPGQGEDLVRVTKLGETNHTGLGFRIRIELVQTSSNDGYRSMIDRPKLIHGTIVPVRHPQRVQRVQFIICQLYDKGSKPLRFVSNFYASHVQCFIAGWSAVHLFPGLANRRQAILWRRQLDTAIEAGINKYEARGYTFQPPAPQLEIPRKRIQTSDGSASVITFDQLYDDFVQCAPEFEDQVHHYRAIREAGLNMMSWFITNKGELEMNIDKELNDIRESTPPANELRMIEHIATHAPQNHDVIRRPREIGYDEPYRTGFIVNLATSGVKKPLTDVGAYSFLL